MNTTQFGSPPVYRISVDEYERMAGRLDDDRVELIDGFLVKKMGKNPPNVWSTDAIVELLKTMTSGYWRRQEAPVRIPDFDEPEPDVSVVRGSRDDYRDRI
jgi:Uma2 family endonuclease